MRVATGVIVAVVAVATGFGAATQMIAAVFASQSALGHPLFRLGDTPIYAPWSVIAWNAHWGRAYPKPFAVAQFLELGGVTAALLVAVAAAPNRLAWKPFGKEAWATFADVQDAGLFAASGAVIGKFKEEILCFDGPEHQVLIGASRSGKGRGHVVPTLLSWGASALVLDVKGELDAGDPRHGFPGTSGFRAELGPVLRFAPTSQSSNCFNPLLEVRKGPNEVRDAQNVIESLIGPSQDERGAEVFWNNSAKIIMTGVVLHVLYAEPTERKTLAIVREKLRDLDRTCDEMRRTLHRLSATTGRPEVHPEVLHAAESYLAGEERLRSGIKATAESFFGIFADPLVAANTSRSDFRVGDLMCGDRPVTLFLQPTPSDAQRLMPLMRLMINQVARSLMEDQTKDAAGRVKRHRLLLLLDEFPQLGRLSFFETMMGAMAGYGLKAYLVCQSLNHITRAYGRDSVILDNCHLVTAFAAADPETAKRIADMAGEVWEIRPQRSEQQPRSFLGQRKGTITYREERRPLMLPADVRGLPRSEQLVFVSGMKPLRAKKLRFDAEAIFAARLRPPAPVNSPISQEHDWTNVVPIGRLPPEKKTVAAAKLPTTKRPAPPRQPATATAPPVAPPTPVSSGQPDLFQDAPPQAPPSPSPPPPPPPVAPNPVLAGDGRRISEIALAGFRDTPPPAPENEIEQESEPPSRRAKATGV